MSEDPNNKELNNNIQIKKYPYPIAHAWSLANNYSLSPTVRHINAIACFYQCLRLIAIAYAGWYVYRLKPNSKIEKALINLKRPTMGSWYAFIKSCMKNVFYDDTQEHEVLGPLIESIRRLEQTSWDSGNTSGQQKNKISLSPLAWLINHRNTYHGHFTTLTDDESIKALEIILPKISIILKSLQCLADYSLVYKDAGSHRVFELNAQVEEDFPEIKVVNNLDELLIDTNSTEVVALLYPQSELVIPLTFFVTRGSSEDDYDGLIRFNTTEINGEPLIFDGINIREKQVIYLGSGSRRFRARGYDYFENFFSSRTSLLKSLFSDNSIVDILDMQLHTQLHALEGNKYQPQTYISREVDSYLLKHITNSPDNRPVSLILGRSGSGKTSLICNMAHKIYIKNNDKHQVSLQIISTLNNQTQNLEYGLANSLGYKNKGEDFNLKDLLDYWLNKNNDLKVNKPYLWIFWDALNEGAKLEEIFNWIEGYAKTIAEFNANNNANVRLIASCRIEPWNELVQKTKKTDPDAWPIDTVHFQNFKNADNKIFPFFILERFTIKQARSTYETYQTWAIQYNKLYCNCAWSELTEEQKDFLRLPLNIWLFHNTFAKEGFSAGLTLSTYSLWVRNISNLVFKNSLLHSCLIFIGQLMWDNQSSSIDVDELLTYFYNKHNEKTAASIDKIGMTVEQFAELEPLIQQVLLKSENLNFNPINPIELLDISGLIVADNETIRLTYQTLSEAIATIVVWQDILPEYTLHGASKKDILEPLLIGLQRDQSKIDEIDRKFGEWQLKAHWQDGKTALYNIWATRAKLALQEQHFTEAQSNLQHLQLRAQSHLVISIIKKHNHLTDPTAHLKINSILFDMIHIQGNYKEAATLIYDNLQTYEQSENVDDLLILKLKIRYIHHRMFYDPIQPLWLECQNLLNQIDIHKYPEQYGETLFMLGGNLGALAGDYDSQRKVICKAIRHASVYNDEYLMSRSLRKYVDYLRQKNKFLEATKFLEAAWRISEKSQTTRQGIYLSCVAADIQRQMGNDDLAIQKFKEAMSLAEKSQISGWIAHTNLGLAEVYVALNDLEKATLYLDKANAFYCQINQAWGRAQVLITRYRMAKLTASHSVETAFSEALDLCNYYGYLEDEIFLIEQQCSKQLLDRCLMFL